MSPSVAVQDLRVGMYVHLDLGWMAHPFPLSSFRITSPEQITTICGLPLQRVRWAPEKSVLDAPASRAAAAPAPPAAAAEPVAAAPVVETADQAAARQRGAELAAQRAAAQLCAAQYAEAGQAMRSAADAVLSKPQQARGAAEALAGGLLDKLTPAGEVCIRLLSSGASEGAADAATAHALNVAVISLLMGRSFGLERGEMLDMGVGALLHDVGKLELPERHRHHADASTAAEQAAYRSHVDAGVALGRRMGLSSGALQVLAQHHEHADGSGFPLQLGPDRMSTAARIVALVNRYDNLCNPPQLQRALTPHEALSMLFAQGRGKVDASILNGFIRMMGVYPAGSLVQLTDDRYAMVVGSNASRPLRPRVLVHDPATAPDDAVFVDLDRQADLGIRRSLSLARLPPAALAFLAPGSRVAYFFEPVRATLPERSEQEALA